MPYGTDSIQVEAIGRQACEKAYHAGARVLLLPTVPFGVNTNHLNVPGAVACSVRPTTLLCVLRDLVESLEKQRIRKLVLLNGHGGNELKPLMRELHQQSHVFLCLCDWYRMVADRIPQIFEQPGEHADEVETSLGLAYFPELVHLPLADAGAERPTRFEAINRGWITITRPWHLATTNTGLGNPAHATADKGRRLMDVIVERLSQFLVALAHSEVDERFPY
jgi:creatinine amidohydrolase